MSGREAFHEFLQDAFESLKQLGEIFVEAIVAQAEAPVEAPPARMVHYTHPDVWIVIVRDVQDRFDWKLTGWHRREDRAKISIRVRLKCGHIGLFEIDALSFMKQITPSNLLDHILDEIEKPPLQRCKCGTPQGLRPAGVP